MKLTGTNDPDSKYFSPFIWRATAPLKDWVDSKEEMLNVVDKWQKQFGQLWVQFQELDSGKYEVWGQKKSIKRKD